MITDQCAGLFVGAIPGANGVDGNLAALRSRDGLFESDTARVVFAIAYNDEYPGNRLDFGSACQLVGGEGNRVPQRRPTPGCELIDGASGARLVCGEILHKKHRAVDANDER